MKRPFITGLKCRAGQAKTDESLCLCVCACVCVCVSVCLSPPLLVEEAGEGLTADLFGEVIFPPQNTVSVLLVVPLTGGDVRALRDRQQININTTVFNEMR